MRRLSLLPALALSVACSIAAHLTANAAPFTAWNNLQLVEIPTAGLLKFSLPPETLDAARPDLGDLRLADPQGNEVPWFHERTAPVAQSRREPLSFKVQLDPQSTTLTLETGTTDDLGALHLRSPSTGFLKAASVAGSTDGTTWQPLVTGQPLFHEPGGTSQLRIALPKGRYAFLRLTLDDRTTPPIPVTGAGLETAATEVTSTESATVRITGRTELPGETRLVLDLGAANLRLATLEFDTPEPLLRRTFTLAVRDLEENRVRERVLATDTIHRVAVDGQPGSERLRVPLALDVPSRELILRIRNDDSPPLRLNALRATRWPVYFLFLASAPGNYQLFSGHPTCPSPRYDLASQGINTRSAQYADTRPGPVQPNPAFRQPDTLPQIGDSGADLDVQDWTFRKPVQVPAQGVQQLELDLEVLTHAQHGLNDLRLMRNGRQVPFILEPTSVVRSLKPVVTLAHDPKRPGITRWSLQVPHADLPLQRLTCSSPTPLFQRTVALLEDILDNRGTPRRRELGTASWTQSPGQPTRTLTLALHTRPQTDQFWLETDNGDNPAIALTGFEFEWPVTRLHFKTVSDGPIHLYYGNDRTGAPQYDLRLVAHQLLIADPKTATLGAEEQLKPSPWTSGRLQNPATWALWIVLGLVVIGLLWIIGRLVPRSTSGSP